MGRATRVVTTRASAQKDLEQGSSNLSVPSVRDMAETTNTEHPVIKDIVRDMAATLRKGPISSARISPVPTATDRSAAAISSSVPMVAADPTAVSSMATISGKTDSVRVSRTTARALPITILMQNTA